MNIRLYDTLIFDLGEVIVPLSFEKVITQLNLLSGKDGNTLLQLITQSDTLQLFETGKMSESEFLSEINGLLGTQLETQAFEKIWNDMLLEIPQAKINLLQNLKQSHQVMIMSNTNSIHQRCFDSMVAGQTGGKSMADLVHHAYYSHVMGLRKPQTEVFSQIIREHKLDPSRTLFLDDRAENVEAARQTGINGIVISHPDRVMDIFNGHA